MGRKYSTLNQVIADLLKSTEVKNEDGDILTNLHDEGRDCKDWVSMSKADLTKIIKEAFVLGAHE